MNNYSQTFFSKQDSDLKDGSAKGACLSATCSIPLALAVIGTINLSTQSHDPTTKGLLIAGTVAAYLLFLLSIVLCVKSCEEDDNNERQRLSPKA